MELLLEVEEFNNNVWEPACGMKHLANVLTKNGYNVRCSDIVDRVGDGSVELLDFLFFTQTWDGDIITNPPYSCAREFTEAALSKVSEGRKVAMFLKLTFLEGKTRRRFFQLNPPKIVYVFSSRIVCAKDGDFNVCKSSAVAYAWFVWEKGYKGDTSIRWIG